MVKKKTKEKPTFGWSQKVARDPKRAQSRYEFKQELLALLGGKCVDCGYDKHSSALDFDHKDPKTKKFAIAQGLNFLGFEGFFKEQVKAEALKCEIRCANCHRIKSFPLKGINV